MLGVRSLINRVSINLTPATVAFSTSIYAARLNLFVDSTINDVVPLASISSDIPGWFIHDDNNNVAPISVAVLNSFQNWFIHDDNNNVAPITFVAKQP